MRGLLFLEDVFEACVGYTLQERSEKQEVEIKAEILVDVERSAMSDALLDTVDLDSVRKIIEDSLRKKYKLIERLAVKLLEDILRMDERVESVAIEVKKLNTHTGIKVERRK